MTVLRVGFVRGWVLCTSEGGVHAASTRMQLMDTGVCVYDELRETVEEDTTL